MNGAGLSCCLTSVDLDSPSGDIESSRFPGESCRLFFPVRQLFQFFSHQKIFINTRNGSVTMRAEEFEAWTLVFFWKKIVFPWRSRWLE
ncbi:hypothetical protein Sfum_2568 [Syntrophobacter fumaroxidans MPOB]|uniref:Uncharacterized protein n=1 Tax=Syntrophobacter fumaroxidans (strain DSM 10017 / MPOB) TaxID=335543 RepID=A0LLE4_SYNFM|nr:hypothetical protein Sfum_2568 [Syntrophobacter fumaroxidans MPOB]